MHFWIVNFYTFKQTDIIYENCGEDKTPPQINTDFCTSTKYSSEIRPYFLGAPWAPKK